MNINSMNGSSGEESDNGYEADRAVELSENANTEASERQVGRPTKYNEETVARLCEALGDGMSIKSGCVIAGIGVQTLSDWRREYPELEQRLTESRELFREKALQTIKKAIYQDDWRAAAKALELIFPADYRAGNKVTATATATASTAVVSVEKQKELQERKARALQDIKP
jgi:hypothetical protein